MTRALVHGRHPALRYTNSARLRTIDDTSNNGYKSHRVQAPLSKRALGSSGVKQLTSILAAPLAPIMRQHSTFKASSAVVRRDRWDRSFKIQWPSPERPCTPGGTFLPFAHTTLCSFKPLPAHSPFFAVTANLLRKPRKLPHPEPRLRPRRHVRTAPSLHADTPSLRRRSPASPSLASSSSACSLGAEPPTR